MQHTVSTKTLVKASVSATVVAAIALVTFILPAEYNIDPTGVGQKLGLTSIAQAAEADGTVAVTGTQASNTEFQTIEVVVPAGRGVEYKFAMTQYAKMTYEWITDGDALYFDLHGEPKGDTTGYFESYTIATSNEMKGSFTAPFAGSHGWYWKNKTDKPIAVQLQVKGQYEVIGLKQ
ncbi:hypothetical protein N5C36_12320 [Shewanella xiamenensis]|jgi:hypothetical protein|uniref:Transmembrane anchor protein n=1 Tax=Shewanella decolorationis TaxID=256839 RepID=A0A5B8R240_9GAMM|nr:MULTISPECIES: hypothetical protein [Shewanella]MBW0279374.1 hypothetical protein [Shewanella xiamenensis]MCT8874189.1 hypothetical protein [Shewanella xiamenensis]MDH1314866.1 hypothetical protein [Shewanella xiamenensis]QWY79380.1 hypothetical protein D0436_24695 [Shewanella decolorationis]UWH42032.1 hypothetical protein KXJ80_01725 [Shewanella xiamenensis]